MLGPGSETRGPEAIYDCPMMASLLARPWVSPTLALMLLACSGSAPPPPRVEPPPPVAVQEVEPTVVEEQEEAVEDDVAPEGPACEHTDECADGQHCRGPVGCESEWACGAARECGDAMVAYCGCDGFTFYALENCPGQPFQSVGPCEALGEEVSSEAHVDDVEGNTICTSSDECRSGYVCAGTPGCSTFWTCVRRRTLRCARAQATFCGCNGQSFQASDRCPGRPVAHAGYCPGDEPRVAEPSGAEPSAEPSAAVPSAPSITPPASTTPPAVRAPAAAPSGPAPCMSSRDCPRGLVCQGPAGCTDEWTCGRPQAACVSDTQYFCGCDGESFRASMTCPGRPHRYRGSCRE